MSGKKNARVLALLRAKLRRGAGAPRLALKESSSEERIPAEPGPKQGEASLRRGSPAPRKMDS